MLEMRSTNKLRLVYLSRFTQMQMYALCKFHMLALCKWLFNISSCVFQMLKIVTYIVYCSLFLTEFFYYLHKINSLSLIGCKRLVKLMKEGRKKRKGGAIWHNSDSHGNLVITRNGRTSSCKGQGRGWLAEHQTIMMNLHKRWNRKRETEIRGWDNLTAK